MLPDTVAQSKSKRRSRKRHNPGTNARRATPTPPRATPAQRRERALSRARPSASSSPGTRAHPLRPYGPPPPGRFGGVPVPELAIFVGAIGFVIGLVGRQPVPLIVGLAVCALGVLEFTTREHFSGYRSHTTLLSAFPAVIVEAALVLAIRPSHPLVVLPAVVPVYALSFWLLRRRFMAARQLRLARPPRP
jgi:hypothetical protein